MSRALLEGHEVLIYEIAWSAKMTQDVPQQVDYIGNFIPPFRHVLSSDHAMPFQPGMDILSLIAETPQVHDVKLEPTVADGNQDITQLTLERYLADLDHESAYRRRAAAINLQPWIEAYRSGKDRSVAKRKVTMREVQQRRGRLPVWAELPESANVIPFGLPSMATMEEIQTAYEGLVRLAANNEEHLAVRCAAVWTLGYAEDRRLAVEARNALEVVEETPVLRAFVLDAVCRLGASPSLRPHFQYETHYGWDRLRHAAVELSKSTNQTERERAASALRFIWFPGAIQPRAKEAHQALLTTNTSLGRAYAAEAIRRNLKPAQALAALLPAYARESDEMTRRRIAREFTVASHMLGGPDRAAETIFPVGK